MNTVTSILNKYWDDGSLPVDPAYIANRMGVVVASDPNLNGSGHYEPCGSNDGGPLITYNPNESIVRQRFTIAHELGHHVLGHGAQDRDTPANFMMPNNSLLEKDANTFAAQLLMPKDFLKAVIEVRLVRDIATLASMFKVSKPAMSYRLRNLGYDIRS
ncbi:ImmA/IrrE family metallo-endopeptidase [Desulfovibrio falkowii]|uniref:ImmA/IrrE family metallo-endopeptidase n=1 Tax=Desulfovibrio falkowii TaxID=3136602 RepID=A0ABQ0E9Y8_9BACT